MVIMVIMVIIVEVFYHAPLLGDRLRSEDLVAELMLLAALHPVYIDDQYFFVIVIVSVKIILFIQKCKMYVRLSIQVIKYEKKLILVQAHTIHLCLEY